MGNLNFRAWRYGITSLETYEAERLKPAWVSIAEALLSEGLEVVLKSLRCSNS